MKKIGKKGMTMVEIMVVLLIASIAMTITCGILVNSLGYFDSNTKNSLDKQAADGILDYIKNEIEYATDVTVSQSCTKTGNQDGWHCMYVATTKSIDDNGKKMNTLVLYRDNVEVFSVDYYSKRNLDIKIKRYSANKHRLDMSVVLNDSNQKEVYKTSNTFELLNLNMKSDNEETMRIFNNINPSYKSLFYEGENIGTDNSENSKNYVLWYIKDSSYKISGNGEDDGGNDSDETDSTGDGTVADIVKNIDSSNYIGIYFDGINYQFNPGDIVWYNGYYWQNTQTYNNNNVPGASASGASWKRLSSEYDKNSSYENGDIIIYKKYYYQCVLVNEVYNTSFNPKTGSQWKLLGRTDDLEVVAQVRKNTYEKKASSIHKATVLDNHLTDEKYKTALQDPMKSKFKEFISGNVYEKGAIVKKISGYNAKYYDLWIAAKKTISAPGKPSSGWVKLDNVYDKGSSYTEGDIVYSNNLNHFSKARKDIFDDKYSPQGATNEYWEY